MSIDQDQYTSSAHFLRLLFAFYGKGVLLLRQYKAEGYILELGPLVLVQHSRGWLEFLAP